MTPSIPLLVFWWVIICSCITFITMGIDKRAAFSGSRRVSEKTLLLLALAGGWPGTLAAMQWYRHKRRKQFFGYRCFLAIICNIWLIWAVLAMAKNI